MPKYYEASCTIQLSQTCWSIESPFSALVAVDCVRSVFLLVAGPFGAVSYCDSTRSSCQCSFLYQYLDEPALPQNCVICMKNFEQAIFGVSHIFHRHAFSLKNKKDVKIMRKLNLRC